jgi:hypothetical protein
MAMSEAPWWARSRCTGWRARGGVAPPQEDAPLLWHSAGLGGKNVETILNLAKGRVVVHKNDKHLGLVW